ncbi:MAG: hypothetical protein ACYCOY_10975 [Metallibacterium sp.]
MKLVVPKFTPKPWQADLGLAACLISARGELPRISLTQRRAVLAVAYQVRIARLHGVDPRDGAFRTRWPKGSVRSERRRISVRLNGLDLFAPGESVDLAVHEAFDRFAAAVSAERVKDLVQWAPPVVARDTRTGRLRVHANQLTTALARYRLPHLEVPAVVCGNPPKRQLTFTQAAALMLHVFGDFIDGNVDLICRLCGTAMEGGLLIEKSVNTAALIRQRFPALEL